VKTLLRLFAITAGIAIVYAAGFLYFVMNLPTPQAAPPHADGIVALTGGHARLDAAVGLLENGAARRLLITGVFETTTKEGLAERVHGGPRSPKTRMTMPKMPPNGPMATDSTA
jgi:hypothetical protein